MTGLKSLATRLMATWVFSLPLPSWPRDFTGLTG